MQIPFCTVKLCLQFADCQHITLRRCALKMCCLGSKLFWLKIFIILYILLQGNFSESAKVRKLSKNKSNLTGNILKLLNTFEKIHDDGETVLSANIKLSLLLSEFLIKQKVRFYESSRFEEQSYYHILKKVNGIIRKADNSYYPEIHRIILDNVFQKDVLLIPPTLKQGQIDTHLEYKILVRDYDELLRIGLPNDTLSDFCLASIVTLDKCNLRDDCWNIITSDLPTFGYQRLHQILLLYVLMHHECSTNVDGAKAAYETLASEMCAQVYREQNAIRSHGISMQYRDLFLEQNVLCGLFGYAEFLNWYNLEIMMSWDYIQTNDIASCFCLATAQQEQQAATNVSSLRNNKMTQDRMHEVEHIKNASDCNCNNHINSLALVYYINALLLLN